jgi:hypothetical protein
VRPGTFGGRFARPNPRWRGPGKRMWLGLEWRVLDVLNVTVVFVVGQPGRLVSRAGVVAASLPTKRLVYRLVYLQKIQEQRTRIVLRFHRYTKLDKTSLTSSASTRISTNVSGQSVFYAVAMPYKLPSEELRVQKIAVVSTFMYVISNVGISIAISSPSLHHAQLLPHLPHHPNHLAR